MGYRQTHADGGLGSIDEVVSSLPAGYELGEERVHTDGNVYRLFYNACNQQISTGYLAARNVGSAAAAGPYSATVTTTTEVAYNAACAVVQATATTGTYFWGLVETRGEPVSLNGVTAVAGDGTYIHPAADGQVTNGTTQAVGYCVSTSTTDTTDGSFHLSLEDRIYNQ